MKRRIWLLVGSVILPVIVLFNLTSWWSRPTHAAPTAAIVVNTLDDELNSDGDCSLREAITAANDNNSVDGCLSGSSGITDTITINVAGTITLTAQLSVTAGGPLSINGGGSITVNGNDTVRIFYVASGANLLIQNITLADGYAEDNHGGGIWNHGKLMARNSALLRNATIYSIDPCYGGGGIANDGLLTIRESLFSANKACYGGGVFNSGLLTITQSTLSYNTTLYDGGGIFNGLNDEMYIANTNFDSNNADNGGGISNSGGTVQLDGCQFNNNIATEEGGGISSSGTMTLSNSTLIENTASTGGGMGTHPPGQSDNSAIISNSTFHFNYADSGGAIYVKGASLQDRIDIANSTIASNIANNGGGIYITGGVTEVYNSILTDSPFDANCAGFILDGGHNIDSGDTCDFDLADGSLINTDPLLGPLQDNGGETWTHALLYGSPAIDAADQAHCPPSDQRGVYRPQDGDGDGNAICDIGSFEYLNAVTLTDVSIAGQTAGDAQVNHTFTATSSPISATLPITYGWHASGQTPVTHTGGLTDTVVYTWDLPGNQRLTVTASNPFGSVTDTHTITITEVPISGLAAVNNSPTMILFPTILSATINAGTNVSYTWDLGDGSIGSGAVVSHIYPDLGFYTASITASNSANTLTATTAVTISELIGDMYLPAVVKENCLNDEQIAFISTRDGNREVYSMNVDGTCQTNLTNNPAHDGYQWFYDHKSPAWSPDGAKIAFYSERDGNGEIYVMNADGTGPTNLTDHPASDRSPIWSPDGSKIAFLSTRDTINGNLNIYSMKADGTGLTKLTHNSGQFDFRDNFHHVWSPDGYKIAFVKDSNFSRFDTSSIFVMNADGSGQTCETDIYGDEDFPAWSPDSTKIAFWKTYPAEIYIMNADCTGQAYLTNLGSRPVWSPDGSKIAIGKNGEIYVINVDGTGLTNVTNFPGDDDSPVWSPDGAMIAFIHQFSHLGADAYDIYVMNADGSGLTRLTTHPASDIGPAWRPQP
jgi:TolB protein